MLAEHPLVILFLLLVGLLDAMKIFAFSFIPLLYLFTASVFPVLFAYILGLVCQAKRLNILEAS